MDMVNNGTYVHKQVDRPLPRWAWGWGERPDREDCVCADCNLMDEYMVSPHDVSVLISTGLL